jgi:hypothetical protein
LFTKPVCSRVECQLPPIINQGHPLPLRPTEDSEIMEVKEMKGESQSAETQIAKSRESRKKNSRSYYSTDEYVSKFNGL